MRSLLISLVAAGVCLCAVPSESWSQGAPEEEEFDLDQGEPTTPPKPDIEDLDPAPARPDTPADNPADDLDDLEDLEGDAPPEPSPKPASSLDTPDAPSAAPASAVPRRPKLKIDVRDSTPATTHPDFDRLVKLGDLERLLRARAQHARDGDQKTADADLIGALDAKKALGVRNVRVASYALMHEADAALASNDGSRALQLAGAAADLSPDLATAHWYLASTRLAEADIGGFFVGSFNAVRAGLRSIPGRVALLWDTIGIVGGAIFLMLLVYLVLQLVKYLPYAGHDVADAVPGVSRFQGGVICLFILLSPLAFDIGLAPTVLIWLALVGLYQSPGERVTSGIAAVLFAALPAALYYTAPSLSYHESTIKPLFMASTDAFAPEAEQRLEKLAASDASAAFVLGTRARLRGDITEAKTHFEKAAKLRSGFAAAENNLGNVEFLLQRPDVAEKHYKSAQSSGRAEPLINLATLYLERSQFDQAKKVVEQARRIDPALVQAYNSYGNDSSAVEKLIDVRFDEQQLWARAFSSTGGEPHVAAAFMRRLSGRLPFWFTPGLALLLGLSLIAFRKRALPLSTSCPRCGEPASQKASDQHCEECEKIFLLATAVDPRTRFDKEKQIRRHHRLRRFRERVFSLLAGAGDVLAGEPGIGMLSLFILALAITNVVWIQFFGFHPWSKWSEPTLFRWAASGLVAVLVTLLSVRRTLER